MRDRKASVSATPHFITQGLSQNTVSTPDEVLPPSGGGLGSYFSLSRQPSTSGNINRPLSRRPSLTSPPPEPLASSASSTFSLKLSHPRAPGAPGGKMFSRTNTGGTLPPPPVPSAAGIPALPPPPTSPNGLYSTVHETCTKRIATLDYLRRAHEGRVYFFNVMLTPRSDLQKIVHPDVKKLQKKASHFFMLGNSLPSILDVGTTTQSALEYLRAFNALLQEYETHIALPPNRLHSGSISSGPGGGGGSNSSLRNMSVSKFFSRAGHVRQRRGSIATGGGVGGADLTLERTRSASNSSISGGSGAMNISGPTMNGGEDTVPPLPVATPALNSSAEEYIYLTTPALPFDPDYFETFATLCDVLIDVYSRVLMLVNAPNLCGPGIGEAFLKADAKIRRIVVAGTVREWEDAVRSGVKREVGGVAREVLGGML